MDSRDQEVVMLTSKEEDTDSATDGDSTTVWVTDTTQLVDTDGETTTTTMLVMDTVTDSPGDVEPTDSDREEPSTTVTASLLKDTTDLDPSLPQVVIFTLSPDMQDSTDAQLELLEEITFQAHIDFQARLITTELRDPNTLLKVSTDQDSPTEQVLIETTKSLDKHANREDYCAVVSTSWTNNKDL